MKNTKKIRRQQVKEEIADVSPWDLSGSPEDICKELRETQDAYLKKYNKEDILEVSWTWETSSYGDEEGHFSLTITRLENDNEYDRRVKQLMKIDEQEKILKQKQEQDEYAEYLRLQKKFENNSTHTKYDWKNDWSRP